MARDNIRVTNLANLAALKLAKDWDAIDRWGRVDHWLVGVWVFLLVSAFFSLIYCYTTVPTVLPAPLP